MRIVQIIDSLEAGGAERMAINYANVLADEITFSGLISTRKEGILKEQINSKVSYLFLKKEKRFDFKAILRLRKYILKNQIEVIHAHSSSFFIAVLIKLTISRIKIIWHDHYGISQDLSRRKSLGLKLGSLFFTGIISVNTALKEWSVSNLFCKNVVYFPNFIDDLSHPKERLILNGISGKRIICVANLRPQKNHQFLIETADILRNKYPEWTFHLFGKDFKDYYSEKIKLQVKESGLEQTIFFYGTSDNIVSALQQSDIAVLPSLSEGLPLSVLEYGLYKMPVIATDVGEISKIITSEKEGLIIKPGDSKGFLEAIEKLIDDENYRKKIGVALYEKVQQDYSKKRIIKEYFLWLNSLHNFTIKKSSSNK